MIRKIMTTDGSPTWSFYALCRGKEYMFDSQEDYNGRDYYPFEEEAKALCVRCPVWENCQGEAFDNKEPQGIWAGRVRNGK